MWMFLVRTSPSRCDLARMVLLLGGWSGFCANKLVWDCTLIDEDEDASGQGLLQKARPEPEVKNPSKVKRKRIVSSNRRVSPVGGLFFAAGVAVIWGLAKCCCLLMPPGRVGGDWLFLLFTWRPR